MGALLRSERGQSSVEYALVLVAFLSMVVALGSIWHLCESGTLTRQALRAASHSLERGLTPGLLQDVLAY